MNKRILTDSCFWLGLVDPTDQHHLTSLAIADMLDNNQVIFPWPCLYETMCTHLARRRERLIYLEEIVSRENIILFDDAKYREEAIYQVFEFNRIEGHTYSLTDSVLREILKDININVNYLITYNEPDFKDICDQRYIEIISS